jgi:hypothetical protein
LKISTILKIIFPVVLIMSFLVVSIQAVTISTTFNYIATTGQYQVRNVNMFGNSTTGGEHYNNFTERIIWGSTNVISTTECDVSFYRSQNTTNNPECGGDGASGWGSSSNIQLSINNSIENLTDPQILHYMLPQDVDLDDSIVAYSDYHADLIYNAYNVVNVTGYTYLVDYITNSTTQPVAQQHSAEALYNLEYESECQETGKYYNVSVQARFSFSMNSVHIIETYFTDQNVTILNETEPDFASREIYNSTLKCTNMVEGKGDDGIPGFQVPLVIGTLFLTTYVIVKKNKLSVKKNN